MTANKAALIPDLGGMEIGRTYWIENGVAEEVGEFAAAGITALEAGNERCAEARRECTPEGQPAPDARHQFNSQQIRQAEDGC